MRAEVVASTPIGQMRVRVREALANITPPDAAVGMEIEGNVHYGLSCESSQEPTFVPAIGDEVFAAYGPGQTQLTVVPWRDPLQLSSRTAIPLADIAALADREDCDAYYPGVHDQCDDTVEETCALATPVARPGLTSLLLALVGVGLLRRRRWR